MMLFEERYKKLNQDQKNATNHTEGPLLVVAGPGSGKTELLGIRVGSILKKTDTPPESILCLTYTEAASSNMKERLIDLIGEDGYKVPVHTFHGFCKKIMEFYPEHFFKGAFFNVADDATRTGIIEDILSNLDHNDLLSGFHPQKGYVYLESIKGAVTQIKESGLTVEEFKKLISQNKKFLKKTENKIEEIFGERVNRGVIPKIELFIQDLRKEDEFILKHVKSLPHVLADSLELAVKENNTTAVSNWKNEWTKKKKERRVLKNLLDIEKMESLANIYEKYKEKMYSSGYYEFLDMLLDVAIEIENSDSLRSELQEKYLYFLVDEFQDTNGIQMRILNLLIEDETDQKPNVCVVGDDDQAIYRFQGADLSNILDFKNSYSQTKVITLVKNYRSNQEILNLARKVILKGEKRLENTIEEVKKELKAQKKKGEDVFLSSFITKEEEFSFVARRVKEKIEKGVHPQEIAVIGRTHKSLKEISPFFSSLKIPTYSERKENVLEKTHVRQIVAIVKFATLLLEEREKAEELLPEIMSFPFWGIEREKILEISKKAYEKRRSWIDCLNEDKKLKKFVDFLVDLSMKAKYKSLEEVIDIVIGNKKGYFQSPFKEFYFSKEKLEKEKSEYLDLLSSLKRFIKGVRDYKAGSFTKAEDLVEFLEIHEQNSIPILNKNPLVLERKAVSLITAHSAKGKEFDTVFVLNCQKEEWGTGRGKYKTSLPANIPFKKAGDENDDRLRLFYVALTRAKNSLYLVSYENEEDGRSTTPLEFLSGVKKEKLKTEIDKEGVRSYLFSFYKPPFYEKEKDLLFPLVENYKLSATGLNKFLDVTQAGPQSFFEESILHFPKKKSLPLSYGTAVHSTITEIYARLKREGEIPKIGKIIKIFENYLKKERLSKKDFTKLLKQGKEELSLFYKIRKKEFSADHIIEKNFQNEDSVIDKIEITGKIDKIVKNKEKIKVCDFKTGSPLDDWEGKTEYEKIKGWKYKNQLIFYKLLVESSREFGGKCFVESGALEFIKPNKDGEIISLPLEIKKEDEEKLKSLIKAVGDKIKKLDFPSTEKYKKKTLKEIKRFEKDLLKGEI